MEYSKTRFFLLLGLVSLAPVRADYELRGQIFSFDNPTGKCEGCRTVAGGVPGCCDMFAQTEDCSGSLQCDIFFFICIRPLGTPSNVSIDFCPYGSYFTSTVYFDIGTLTFTNGTFLGLPNPLALAAQAGRWMGLQLFMVVGDLDPPQDDENPNDLVDQFTLDFAFSAGGSLADQSTYQGEFGFISINASFQVQCINNSYGSDCSILCVERDDDQGHYTCDSEGNRVCRDGYQNPDTNCTQCVPADGCSPNAYCNLPDTCLCKEGYSGINCEIDLDPCKHIAPCKNGGVCSNTSVVGGYQCDCVETGYTGIHCESKGSSNIGAVVGAVTGVVLALLVIAAVVTSVACGVVLWRRRAAKLEVAAVGGSQAAVPVDNPTYAMDASPPPNSTIPVQGFLLHQRHTDGTTSRALDITLLSTISTDVDFDNPLYGQESRFEQSMEDSNTYSTPQPVNGFEQTNSTNTYSIPRPQNGFEQTSSTNTYSIPRPQNGFELSGSTGSHTYASIGPRDAPNEYQSSLKSSKYASIKNQGTSSGSHTPPQYSSIGPQNPPSAYLVPSKKTSGRDATGNTNNDVN